MTMCGLIDGLPDAVALRCLALVPYYLYPKLELVCRSWKAAFRSVELFRERQIVGSSEDFLAVCCRVGSCIWQLYDPVHKLWITLPEVPSKMRCDLNFGVVSTCQKIFVMGGDDKFEDTFTTNEVWSFDLITRTWCMLAPMLVSRGLFACCVVDGKIVVAGGYTTARFEFSSKAEMYDIEKDVWIPLPDLHRTPDRFCTGLMIGGKMHIDYCDSSVEVFDSLKLKWRVEDYKWPLGLKAVVRDSLYIKHLIPESGGHTVIIKQDGRDMQVVSSPRIFSRLVMYMVGFRGELYLIGGIANGSLRELSDVLVLNVGDDKPTWRSTILMSPRSYGIVHGCIEFTI